MAAAKGVRKSGAGKSRRASGAGSETPPGALPDGPAAPVAASGPVLWAFTLTTFLSAVLLFSVQPLFAKMVLPYLGGAPAVWAVALLFFQTALLAGYCYAHLLIARLPLTTTGLVHLGLTLVALVSLPIAIPAGWGEPPAGEPYLWQLGLFSVAIGLPFVAVSANAPLLQAWFARSGHGQAADPYFLYAASNLGSLISLLSFPFLLEPVFGLSVLAQLWTGGYVVLVAAIAGCYFLVRNRGSAASSTPVTAGTGEPRTGAGPTVGLRAVWVGLAAVPAGLLTAFTTHIATDVASAPLIWVIPLALYLLTFVIVFRDRALVPVSWLLGLHLAAVVLALLQLSQTWHDTWYLSSAIGTAAFFLTGLVAHRTLYEARPAAAHLTEFYLWMSLGGALGGLFAALVAPRIFPEVFEYPLLLALGMACRPGAVSLSRQKGEALWVWGIGVAGLLLIFFLPIVAALLETDFWGWESAPVAAAILGLMVLLFWGYPTRQFAAALMMCAALMTLPSNVHRGNATRSYFGVYRVLRSLDGEYNLLKHGTTLHGAQRMWDQEGKPVIDTAPKTYYHLKSPMTQAINIARQHMPEGGGPGRFGVVGLGAGSLACLSQAGERWRFFEIDPTVLEIARSSSFTYLSTCQPKTDAVIGDARLTLAKEPDKSFDLLLVDGFSSDAVPMHLLTREALGLYAAKLKDSGLGVLHISNRYLDLEGVLASTIPTVPGLKAFAMEENIPALGYDALGSTIIVFSRDLEVAHRFLSIRGGRSLRHEGLKPWTDDASEILGPFLSKWRRG